MKTTLADFQYFGSSEKCELKFTEFETEKFLFRKFNENDFPVLFEWHSSAGKHGIQARRSKN